MVPLHGARSPQYHNDNNNNNVASSINSLYDENYFADNKGNITLEKLNELPSLNLKLTITSSFFSLVESILSRQQSRTRISGYGAVGRPRKSDVASPQQATEKLKASNFSATLLRIGTWERVARHEGHLVAKCYYAKKKLVWEFLESTLKWKIEILWTEISAIRATFQKNEPGILEIELDHPPSFHHETDPQPRKHTNWKSTNDFTDGQALFWRKHYLKFPPGALDKHYEKLLQCDSRLFALSQQPFPSSQSPYFNFNPDPTDFTNLSFSQHGRPHFNPGLHYSLAHIPTLFVPEQVPTYRPTIQPHFNSRELASPDSAEAVSNKYAENPSRAFWGQVPSYRPTIQPHFNSRELASPDSVMGFSPITEAVSHQYAENPWRAFWGQGLNSSADALPIERVQGQMSIASAIPAAAYYQNNNNNNYIEGGSGHTLDAGFLLSDIENNLMSDSQVEYADENLARIASLNAFLCQPCEGNLVLNTDANLINYGNNVHAAMQYYKDSDNTGMVYPHPAGSLVSPQVPVSGSPRVIPMKQPNNSFHYATGNDNKGVNRCV